MENELDWVTRFLEDLKQHQPHQLHLSQSLVYFGSCLLSFIVSVKLFLIYPEYSEGQLSLKKTQFINGTIISSFYQRLQLERFYPFIGDEDYELVVKKKGWAFQCLLGHLYFSFGIDQCIIFLGNLYFSKIEEQEILLQWVNTNKYNYQKKYPFGDFHLRFQNERLKKLGEFEKRIGIEFTHCGLLSKALSHSHPTDPAFENNQQLEFLGDSVLEFVVSNHLYHLYPQSSKRDLLYYRSILVNNKVLGLVASEIGIPEFLETVIQGEMSPKVKADSLEAFIGALYLDKSLNGVIIFCSQFIFPKLQTEEAFIQQSSSKELLRNFLGKSSVYYQISKEKGPPHDRTFIVFAMEKGKVIGKGKGKTVKEAEFDAASNALSKLQRQSN